MAYASGSDTWSDQIRWRIGDRVGHVSDNSIGKVGEPPRERTAGETHLVWVDWDDDGGEVRGSFADRAWLIRAL